MKYLTFNLKNKWHRFFGGLAVLVVFFIPTTRIVLGQIIRVSAPNKIAPQAPDANRGNRYNNNTSCNVSSASVPESRSTASPMRTSSGSTGSSTQNRGGRSIARPEPK